MERFYKISDEELAAYLEGMLSEKDTAKVDDAMDIDTLEVLSVSCQAMDESPKDNVILPLWKNMSVASVSIRPLHEPLAMAGFLGDYNSDEDDAEDSENDK